MTPEHSGEGSLQHLDWRLGKIEEWATRFETTMNSRFEGLHTSIAALEFVRRDVYTSERRELLAEVAGVRKEVESVRTLAMWAVGLVATVSIGAIVMGILTASGVFG